MSVFLSTASFNARSADIAATSLAKNLYSSSARFVFELLQNADDNSYATATSKGVEPYVSFQILPERIILECNEDGFTDKNFRAICAIGESSKVGAQGYIGEKGIGFKSVFIAAFKVHIQSGNFSFSFTHRRGDSGMGMITPVWETPDASLTGGITRITLFLHDTGSPSDIEKRHEQIVQQLQEIQSTHLLFLRKVRQVHIKYTCLDSADSSTTTFKMATAEQGGRMILRKLVNNELAEQSRYHVTKYTARDLPEREVQAYLESQDSSMSSTAEIVLAFPLGEDDSVPRVIGTQQIYAFLPIKNVGFKVCQSISANSANNLHPLTSDRTTQFLIHSDFVTQANRQDIVTTSPRNVKLADHIALAFIKAIEELCQYEGLRYEWMKYLPQEGDYPWDGYWNSVIEFMKARITQPILMQPWGGGALKRLCDVRYLPSQFLDENDEPIFEDTYPEIYLSKRYGNSVRFLLKDWGLKSLELSEFVDRAEADLKRETSRLRSPRSSTEWHSKAAFSLIVPFRKDLHRLTKRVRSLELMPVQNARWISAKTSAFRTVYHSAVFPTTEGADIPKDLNLNIVDGSASENPQRRILFRNLGIEDLPAITVRKMILEKYPAVVNKRQLFGGSSDEAGISLSHLAFLYLTHDFKTGENSEYRFIRVLTQQGYLISPRSQDVYILNDNRYGVATLLDGLPGHTVAFLSPAYLKSPIKPSDGRELDMGWEDWLRHSLDIRDRPRLIADGTLTDLFRYLIEHRNGDVLGILQAHWEDIADAIQKHKDLGDEIGKIELRWGNSHSPISGCFLPVPELKTRALEYLNSDAVDSFPFLDLSNTLEPDDLSKWAFSHDAFGVGKHENIRFYLQVLSTLGAIASTTSEQAMKVFSLYEAIYRKSRESLDMKVRESQAKEIL